MQFHLIQPEHYFDYEKKKFNLDLIEEITSSHYLSYLPKNLKVLRYNNVIFGESPYIPKDLSFLGEQSEKVKKAIKKEDKTLLLNNKVEELLKERDNNIHPVKDKKLSEDEEFQDELDENPSNIINLMKYLSGKYKEKEEKKEVKTEIDYFPDTLEVLEITKSTIKLLPRLPLNLKRLVIRNCRSDNYANYQFNYDVRIPNFPSTLTYLEISNTTLSSLNLSEMNLKYLNLSNNELTKITLPCYLEEAYLQNNKLEEIEGICNKLTILSLGNNRLKSLDTPSMPYLEYLDINNNNFTSLPSLPSCIKYLNCSKNRLDKFELDTKGILYSTPIKAIEEIDCSYNYIPSLPVLPESLKVMNCSFNYITNLPEALKDTKLVSLECDNNNFLDLDEEIKKKFSSLKKSEQFSRIFSKKLN